MMIGHVKGATRKIGESQGYQGLPIRDAVEFDSAQGFNVRVMQTLWLLSEEDKKRIVEGGAILLTILGSAHPPLRMETVGEEEVSPIPG